jgi:opacity protein-like surface antigen
MKKLFLLIGVVLICGLPALAQDYPKAELFMGYEWIRFGTAMGGNPNVNINGGGGSIAYNFNSMLGLKAEFTGAGIGDLKQTSSTGLTTLTRSANMFTYLFGPQVTIRKSSRVQPFGHLLFGGAYSNYYANVQTQGTVSTTPTFQDAGKQAFALAFGGGIDVKVHKHVAIRVGQFDYFMTRFSGRPVSTSGTGSIGSVEISNQSSFRYMAGVNFLIGGK